MDAAKSLKLYYKSVTFKDISTSVECLEKIRHDNKMVKVTVVVMMMTVMTVVTVNQKSNLLSKIHLPFFFKHILFFVEF